MLITPEDWASLVARPGLIPQMLDAADVDPEHLRGWLTEQKIGYVDPAAQSAA